MHSLYNSQHVFSADSDSHFSVLLFPPLFFSLLPTAFSLRKQILQPQSWTRVHKDNDLLLRVSHMSTYTQTPITSSYPLHHTTITSSSHYTAHAAQCSYCMYTHYRHSYSTDTTMDSYHCIPQHYMFFTHCLGPVLMV